MPSVTKLVSAAMMASAFWAQIAGAADTTHACVESAHEGQRLRDLGKLSEARAQLLQCAVEACPDIVRESCRRWSGEIEVRTPTFVLGARNSSGADVLEVRVTLDGRIVPDATNGRAVPIDPGQHEIVFDAKGKKPVRQLVVAREGEKLRSMVAVFQEEEGGRPAQPSSGGPSVAPVLVAGGISLLALGGFALFGVLGQNEKDHLQSTCAATGSCAPADVSAARTKLIVADISLLVGVGAGVVTGVLLAKFLSTHPASRTGASFSVLPTKDGVFATFEHRY